MPGDEVGCFVESEGVPLTLAEKGDLVSGTRAKMSAGLQQSRSQLAIRSLLKLYRINSHKRWISCSPASTSFLLTNSGRQVHENQSNRRYLKASPRLTLIDRFRHPQHVLQDRHLLEMQSLAAHGHKALLAKQMAP